jgi:cobalt-zinc-cadmium efflux system membrane fusion protein
MVPDAYLQTPALSSTRWQSVGAGSISLRSRAASPQGAVVVARIGYDLARYKRLGDVRAGEVLALVDSLDAAGFSADRSVAAAKPIRQGAPTIAS